MGFSKPVKVCADQELVVTMVLKDCAGDTTARCYYGNCGNPEDYNAIEGNLPDFEMISSDKDGNGTSKDNGQFPFILYSPAWLNFKKILYDLGQNRSNIRPFFIII